MFLGISLVKRSCVTQLEPFVRDDGSGILRWWCMDPVSHDAILETMGDGTALGLLRPISEGLELELLGSMAMRILGEVMMGLGLRRTV